MKRCPECHLAPTAHLGETGVWTIECVRHGHMAFGSSIDGVTANWNYYINFMEKAAML